MAIKKKEVLYAIVIGATIGFVKATAEVIYDMWLRKKIEGDVVAETPFDIWDRFVEDQQKRTEKFRKHVEEFNKKEEETIEGFKENIATMREPKEEVARTNQSKIFTEDYKDVTNEEET